MGRTGGKRGRKKDKEGVAKVKRRIKGVFLVRVTCWGYRHTHTHTCAQAQMQTRCNCALLCPAVHTLRCWDIPRCVEMNGSLG